MAKAKRKAHVRRTQKGKATQVRQHEVKTKEKKTDTVKQFVQDAKALADKGGKRFIGSDIVWLAYAGSRTKGHLECVLYDSKTGKFYMLEKRRSWNQTYYAIKPAWERYHDDTTYVMEWKTGIVEAVESGESKLPDIALNKKELAKQAKYRTFKRRRSK